MNEKLEKLLRDLATNGMRVTIENGTPVVVGQTKNLTENLKTRLAGSREDIIQLLENCRIIDSQQEIYKCSSTEATKKFMRMCAEHLGPLRCEVWNKQANRWDTFLERGNNA